MQAARKATRRTRATRRTEPDTRALAEVCKLNSDNDAIRRRGLLYQITWPARRAFTRATRAPYDGLTPRLRAGDRHEDRCQRFSRAGGRQGQVAQMADAGRASLQVKGGLS